jgi:hypothetical protein
MSIGSIPTLPKSFDDHADPHAAAAEQMIEQRGLTGAEEPGEDQHRDRLAHVTSLSRVDVHAGVAVEVLRSRGITS